MDKDEALQMCLEYIETDAHERKYVRHAIKAALAQPAQEPVAWADLLKEAQQIVESKFLWKKFIDGTPLANDIAFWMADFAQQYTTLPLPVQPAQEPVAIFDGLFGQPTLLSSAPMLKEGQLLYTTPPKREWVGLTDEDRKATLLAAYKEWECEELLLCAREDYLLIEQALKEKNT
jgi:hypothetical protein